MKARSLVLAVSGIFLFIGLSTGCAVAVVGPSEELTTAAADSVASLFPKYTVMEVSREFEGGVEYFEVVVKRKKNSFEVEVAPDGSIGEIESVVVVLGEISGPALAKIHFRIRGATVRRVERTEVRGRPEGGSFVPVEPPVVFYEVEYEVDGQRREYVVTGDGGRPPFEPDDDESEDERDDT